MKLPKPSPKKYISMIVTVIITAAILQYTGIFFETSGELDLAYLLTLGLILPLSTYLWTVITENVGWLPNWDKMNQSKQ